MIRSTQLSLLALAAVAALGMPAAAQTAVSQVTVRAHPPPHVEVRSKVVSYSDLKLNTPDGEEALVGRIRDAAEDVCSPDTHSVRDLKTYQLYQRCIREATQGAVTQVHNPAVSAVYGRVH